jgi:hypothetical protein
MNCIICDEIANAKGSHIIPASLIKNCVGKHYAEESYEIDIKKTTLDIYFGQDNLKNINPEIKTNHYKKDEILCETCEKKLGNLESEISSNFLHKFRIDKYSNNFTNNILDSGFEIIEPKRISNVAIHAYFYSIILRFCRDEELKSGHLIMLTDYELLKIKSFIHGFLYQKENSYKEAVSDFSLILTFDKCDESGSYIFALEESTKPYIFYFCDVIILLFTTTLSDTKQHYFNGCLNSIDNERAKIIVSPSQFYQELKQRVTDITVNEVMFNAINSLCKINNKTYEENLFELKTLFKRHEADGIEDPMFKAFNELMNK